jgi:hypothetical protein
MIAKTFLVTFMLHLKIKNPRAAVPWWGPDDDGA